MAIEWVREAPIGRDARRDTDRASLTREFLVKTDDAADGAWQVRLATDVPRLYDPHPENTAARARDINAAPEQNFPLLWRVRVNYATGVAGSPSSSENPLDKPKQRSWSWVPITEVFERAYDASGNLTVPVQNSAQMPLVPALEDESYLPMLTIVRNEANYDVGLVFAYQATLNADTFYTAPPGTVKFLGGPATEVPDAPFTYWQVTYQFLFRKDGFTKYIPDMGFYELVPGIGWREITTTDPVTAKRTTTKITVPSYLNGAGRTALPGQYVYLPFNLNKRVPFAPLNLE